MLRACVVGTGPSGMYCAKYLLKEWPKGSTVDLIEQLPTPFGLVRFGVAPDHQEVKNVVHDFSAIAEDPRVRFFRSEHGRDTRPGEAPSSPYLPLVEDEPRPRPAWAKGARGPVVPTRRPPPRA